MYKDSVRTSQETRYISATRTNRLMLFRETVAVYCENHTEHTNTSCEKYIHSGDTYSNQCFAVLAVAV
jgi:hypothetical protein